MLPAAGAEERVEVVGEAFGKLIRADEFAYYYKTAALLTRSGEADSEKKEPRTEEEIRQEAWQNLVFVQEANRLGIRVESWELHQELNRLLLAQHITYPSKEYEVWVTSNVREDAQTFERRVEDLLRISKLIKSKMDQDVTVTQEETTEKFLNQHNSFESEYIHFDSRPEAEAFLARLRRRPSIWKETFDRKRSEQGQKGAAWINIMALEALIDLWQIPKDDAYRILQTKEGSFVVARNYYGDAVFRVLLTRAANLEELDETQRAYYQDLLTKVKKQQAAKAYFDELLARAQLRDYEGERKQAQQRKQQETAIARLKERSNIVLQTPQGDIALRLWPDVAPKACENFIGLVERGYYDGLTFHRVIKDFMIQSGDPTATGTGGESLWGKPFEDETREDVVFDRPGLLAMANSGPNTNGSQFFITTVPTPQLNGKHTIFGEVTSGFDVVKKISEVPIDTSNKPTEPQKILTASIQTKAN